MNKHTTSSQSFDDISVVSSIGTRSRFTANYKGIVAFLFIVSFGLYFSPLYIEPSGRYLFSTVWLFSSGRLLKFYENIGVSSYGLAFTGMIVSGISLLTGALYFLIVRRPRAIFGALYSLIPMICFIYFHLIRQEIINGLNWFGPIAPSYWLWLFFVALVSVGVFSVKQLLAEKKAKR